MTEDEAKAKWCPMARYATGANPATYGDWNTFPGGVGSANRCQGSDCMAWRWERFTGLSDGVPLDRPIPKQPGYCGLAGKP